MAALVRAEALEPATETEVGDVEQLLSATEPEQASPTSRRPYLLALLAVAVVLLGAGAFVAGPTKLAPKALVEVLGLAEQSTTLTSDFKKHTGFTYVQDSSLFEAGMAAKMGPEVYDVKEVYSDTNIVVFQRGSVMNHDEGASVTVSEWTQDLHREYDSQMWRKPVRLSYPLQEVSNGDATVELDEKACQVLSQGDNVELSDTVNGHYELHKITATKSENGKCVVTFEPPCRHDHPLGQNLSVFLPEDELPTPAPTPPTPAPTPGIPSLDVNPEDGKVSKLEALASDTWDPSFTAEAAARLPDLDKDDDGTLSEAEWAEYGTLDLDGDGSISQDEAKKDPYVQSKFADWDEDGDKALSQEELLKGGIDIRLLDEDGDGQVTKNEAVAGATKHPGLDMWAAEQAARFTETDTDNDGVLSEEEMKAYETLDADYDGFISEEEAAKDTFVSGRFKTWDTNGDGKLSEEELLQASVDIHRQDANGDGELTVGEILKRESLTDPDVDFWAAEAAARLPGADTNDDGTLSGEEVKAYKTLDADLDGVITKEEASADPYVSEKFAAWDTDGDLELSEEELLEAAVDIHNLDIDRDGAVTKEETVAKGTDDFWAAEEAARFPDTDANGDGGVTEEEMKDYETLDQNLDGFISESEAEKDPYVSGKFDDWDTDGDKKLSQDELLAAAVDINNLDADEDGEVSEKEAYGSATDDFWAAEAAARYPDTDKNGDGTLSDEETKDYETLDSDYDGFITKEEAEKDPYVSEKFPEWDTDGDKKLSEEELLKAAADIDNLDKDDDGKVSEEEAFASPAPKSVWAAEAAARFPDTDKDKDGVLSEEETEPYETLDKDLDGFISEEEASADPYVSGKFDDWDTDGDKKLSEEELWAGAVGVETLDEDGDGAVSQEEAVGALPKHVWAAEAAARFPDTDKDDDGILSEEEMKDYETLDADLDGFITEEEAKDDPYVSGKFDDWDTEPKDGKLSEEELLAATADISNLDKDGDNTVSEEEAMDGKGPWAAEAAARFPDTDKDDDGILSEEEMKDYETLDKDYDGFITEDEAKDDPYVSERFDDWDTNGDKKLDEDELLKAQIDLGKLDTDGDDEVSKDEAVIGTSKYPWAAEAAARYPDTDKNGDGSLSEEEMSDYETLDDDLDGFITKEEAQDDPYVSQKFDKWDTDNDDKLSEEELKAAAVAVQGLDASGDGKDGGSDAAEDASPAPGGAGSTEGGGSDSPTPVPGGAGSTEGGGGDSPTPAPGGAGSTEGGGGDSPAPAPGGAGSTEGGGSDSPTPAPGGAGSTEGGSGDGPAPAPGGAGSTEGGGGDSPTPAPGGGGSTPGAEGDDAGGSTKSGGGDGADGAGDSGTSGDKPGFKDLDTDDDGLLTKIEAEKDPRVWDNFEDFDTDDDGELTEEEYNEGLNHISTLDTTGDGHVSKNEAVTGSDKNFWAAEVSARFPDTDKDGDGVLSDTEMEPYKTLDSDYDGFITQEEAASDPYVNGNFGAWDTDGDKKLSEEELLKASLDIHGLDSKDDSTAGGGDDADTNSDGAVSKNEAVEAATKNFWAAESAARFPDTDGNGDGSLSDAEMEEYDTLDANYDGFITTAEAADDPYVSEKFEDWDTDDDGKLSEEELLQAAVDIHGIDPGDKDGGAEGGGAEDGGEGGDEGSGAGGEGGDEGGGAGGEGGGDTNGDGLVSKNEAVAAAAKNDFWAAEVAARFPDFDKDNNGVLTDAEMARYPGTLDSNKDGFITKEEAGGPASDGYVLGNFDDWDTDGDKRLSQEELLKASVDVKSLDNGAASGDNSAAGDGMVSKDEIVSPHQNFWAAEAAARLADTDKDGNKVLSDAEMEPYDTLDSDYDQFITQEEAAGDPFVSANFAAWDTNNDKKLSEEELLAAGGVVRPEFATKPGGQEKCPPGFDFTTEAECKAAAAALGLPWGFSFYGAHNRPYCLVADDTGEVFFNTAVESDAFKQSQRVESSLCSPAEVMEDTYRVTTGSCKYPIQTIEECSKAAGLLGLRDESASTDSVTPAASQPPSCYFKTSTHELLFNPSPDGAKKWCGQDSQCLCGMRPSGCLDTSHTALNSQGWGCSYYALHDLNECNVGADDDFSPKEMCCVCGGGSQSTAPAAIQV